MDLMLLPRTALANTISFIAHRDHTVTTAAVSLPALCSGVSRFSLCEFTSIRASVTRKRTTTSWSFRHAWWSALRPFWSQIVADAFAASSSLTHSSLPVYDAGET